MKIRTIAIILGDNDFGNTFRPLLEGLKAVFAHRGDRDLSPTECELIIRQSVVAYYVGYQYSFNPKHYALDSTELHLGHIEQYLRGVNILFNEQAEKNIAQTDHDGGAWYLELQSGVVKAY